MLRLPYPSRRCRGLLWSRRNSAVAVVPSGLLANVLLVVLVATMPLMMALPRILGTLLEAGSWAPLIVIAIAAIVTTSVVTVRPDGIRVRRVGLLFLRVEPVPLGGDVYGVNSDPFADEWSSDDDDSFRSDVVYRHGERDVVIDCVGPSALSSWVRWHAARIIAHHPLPAASVVRR